MKSPFTGKEMSIQKEWRTMNFRKEEFKILFHSYKCDDTAEQFEDDLFAQLNYNQLINQYRTKFSIPFQEQIIDIRKNYDISAARMSEILGLGTNSYRQYEGGEVPNQSNAMLIQLVKDPNEFKKLVDLCITLEPKIKEKINHKIESILDDEKRTKFEKQLESYFLEARMPDRFTGYKLPNLSKFTEMVRYFTERLEPWKTKLNKLLFYSDFSVYKITGFSMSGVQYRAIPMGPVPNNFNGIYDYLAKKNEFDISCTCYTGGGIGEQFKSNPNSKFNPEIFSEDERRILEIIVEKFKNTSTNEIIEISHREKAWTENEADRKIIDYNYGFDLIE